MVIISQNKLLTRVISDAFSTLERQYQLEKYESIDNIIKGTNSRQIDAIFCDLSHDSIEALDLLEKIRTISKEIPFIVITDKHSERDPTLFLNRGADYSLCTEDIEDIDFEKLVEYVVHMFLKRFSYRIIKKYEMFIASMFSKSPLPTLTCDLDGTVRSFNNKFGDILCKSENVEPFNIYQLIESEGRRIFPDILEKLEMKEYLQVEVQIICKLHEECKEWSGELTLYPVKQDTRKELVFIFKPD